jgi:hypothetical protein
MEVNDKEMAVRGIGLIRSVADIENIVLTQEEDRGPAAGTSARRSHYFLL